jgi:hypothetical protein
MVVVLVARGRGRSSQVDVGKGLPFLYHGHVGHWPGRGGAKILDPLTITTLPNEVSPPQCR